MNNRSIKDIIEDRYSVRSYSDKPLSEDIIKKINTYIMKVNNPFNKNVKIKLVKKHTDNEEMKLGTYGVIKGAEYFLISACEDDDLSKMALGYSLEKVILYCTSLGLGTVWLGGTFKKGDFARAINLKEDEILPIVSPVGYASSKKSFIASIMGSNRGKRKHFSEIFFNESFDVSLTADEANEYFELLEMLRLAPSAVNKQPWRVLKDKENVHFYLTSINKYTSVDIGIALCHFHLTAIENGLSGEFKVSDPKKDSKNFTYVISWITNS